MVQESICYNELNNQWKATSTLVLGKDVGELNEYMDWLVELNNPRFVKKSSLSGVKAVFTSSEFSDNGKFVSMNEIDFHKRFEPFNINEIKDIDSILEGLQERFYYCGNIVLGNSKFIEKSSNISDSFFVYDSVKISDCKNIAYSQYLRLCENIFGTNEGGESRFCIRCSILFKNTRCFELWKGSNCSDCYYSYGLDGCREAFFSFNLVGKDYSVGNLVLPRDKYLEIKKKLLSEISEQLIKDKKLPSLIEITSNAEIDNTEVIGNIGAVHNKNTGIDKSIINDSFSKTSELLFEKQLQGDIELYDRWLKAHTVVPYPVKSVLSKQPVQMSQWPGLAQLPKNRLVTYNEGLEIGENIAISESQAKYIGLSNIEQIIGRIAYYTPEYITGSNSNLIECQWGCSAGNCYKTVICAYSKNCAYCSWPRSSEYCFGCGIVFDSGFSMKCYDSVRQVRCFEVDGGRNNTDTYFSHNVEGLEQAAFCFNIKNKHYAVGNAEIGKEQFLKVKKMIQEFVFDELNKKKNSDLSIYNICKKLN